MAKELTKEETKIIHAIQRWLEGLTPSQVYALIWLGVRKANDAKVSGSWGNYGFHEINYLIKEIDSAIKRTTMSNGEIKSYYYPKNVILKLSTTVFFEDMLQLTDWYHTEVATKADLVQQLTKEQNRMPFYDQLQLNNSENIEKTLDWALKADNTFEIISKGIVIHDGMLAWLFTTEEELYRLSKKIQSEEHILMDYENDKWIEQMMSYIPYYIENTYTTAFILKLIRALLRSDLAYSNNE
ncbi:hypothetical protein [Brochothrix campestris]|uniref:Uncharacterized protein n=1 Tax=Brochothrix campestris FSL F6-1037 TaxID=1265861 RepID=W7CYS9_9LIST|nr:hypothetical protein [Brochothrix campestris]EUJ42112.1 hypothetical protein BCAMP_00740 [Brochothrix campestris FSL F6-1037]